MDTFLYIRSVTLLLPVFSATTCLLLTLFSWTDNVTWSDRRLKLAVSGFFAATIAVWVLLFLYSFFPAVFTCLNILLLLTFVLVPILLYRVICLFTEVGQIHRRISLWHYAVPVFICLVMFVWWLAIPNDVSFTIVESKGAIIPAGYEAYYWAFTSKPLWRALFGVIYFVLTIRVLYRYYRNVAQPGSMVRRPAGWVLLLMFLSMVMLVTSIVPATVPRNMMLLSLWTPVTAFCVLGQHILLIYHIIRRKYLLYAVAAAKSGEETDSLRRKYHGKPLSRKRLDEYFRHEKPWLRQDFKITDLVEVFDLNRSTISAFINKTYDMNFNRYVNRWRIMELKRLQSLPENKNKRPMQLAGQVGFTDGKHYFRALKTEEGQKGGHDD